MSPPAEDWALALAWVAGLLEAAPRQNQDTEDQKRLALQAARTLLRTMPGFPANDEGAGHA